MDWSILLFFALFATPTFYIKFWFIAFLPVAIGLGMALWKRKISYVFRWALISIPLAYLGALITLAVCFQCLIELKGFPF